MKKQLFLFAFSAVCLLPMGISAHCQMPCGIYHDNMVYDQIDQYVETMFKGLTVLKQSKFDDVHSRNEFIRWVNQKDKASDDVASLICIIF